MASKTDNEGMGKPTQRFAGDERFDFAFRPDTYWPDLPTEETVLSDVKGTVRRDVARRLLDDPDPTVLDPERAASVRSGMRRGKDWGEVYHEAGEDGDPAGFHVRYARAVQPHLRDDAGWYCFHADARAEYLARAWAELSQRDRRTLHLVEVEGLSYEEVGKLLSVGRSNLKMIVFRSRRRIARHMRLAMGRAVSRFERAAS